jgi:hypothetical protein
MAVGVVDGTPAITTGASNNAAELVWWNLIGIATPRDLNFVANGSADLSALGDWERRSNLHAFTDQLLVASGWPEKVCICTGNAGLNAERMLLSCAASLAQRTSR